MKKITFVLLCLAWLIPFVLQAQTATQPAGSGTASDPYQIANLDNLYWVTQNSSSWDKYFVQTADIDASATASWNNNAGFTPIGNNSTHFTGQYNGEFYSIDSLCINQDMNQASNIFLGLFGYTSGAIIQKAILTNVNVTGAGRCGALIGEADSTTISYCRSNGTISGNNYAIGGLIGYTNTDTIQNCYSSGTVNANTNGYSAGGLAGELQNTNLTQSYSTCNITGSGSYFGGLIGATDNSDISDCYAVGDVSGNSQVGGLIGWINNSSLASDCYSTGAVSGSNDIGGLIGLNSSSTVNNSFWDTETSGMSSSSGGTGKTTAEMKTQSTYTNAGWDFTTTWDMNDTTNNGYPFLIATSVPDVTTAETTNIGTDTAQSGGSIVYEGITAITAKGVVWNKTGNPTLTNNLGSTNDGSGSASYISTLTGLSDTTLYYVRAYATNNAGTGYGDVKSFTTLMSEPAAMTPPGNALDFDGTDDYVLLPNESNFDITNAITVAAWIKVDTFTTDWQAIVTKGDGAWRLQRYGNTNHIDFSTNGLTLDDLEGTTDVNDGNWHYIAGVYDGSANKYLYVDGNLDASASITGTISTTDDPVEIAANSEHPDRNFDGLIDEVRIWNIARTQSELNDKMNVVLSGNESGLVAYYKFDVSSGTYLYDHTGNNNLGKLHNMNNSDWVSSGWPYHPEPRLNTKDPFNIGPDTAQSGGTIISQGNSPVTAKGVVWDITGNPTLTNNLGSTNDGSGYDSFTSTLTGLSDTTGYYVRAYATNSYCTTYSDIKSFTTLMSEPAAMTPPGNALDFDGTDDYVLLPNESDFDFTNAMTIAAWIKVDTFTSVWQAIVTKGDYSWRLQRYAVSNHIDFGTSGLSNQDLEGTTDVNDGNWHYIAGVYDGSTKYLYVDGNLDASVSALGNISTTDDSVEIAANSDFTNRNFDGLIDEVRIWNVARTQTQIQQDMNIILTGNESGLVAYYKFDVSSGTYLYDHTGNNNVGRLHNMNNNDWVSSGWPVQLEPVISTTDPFNIGTDTAQSGGNITSKGCSAITAKGVVWNTTGNPTLTDNLGSTNEGGGSDSFTSTLTGLSDTTVYYVKAYATNSYGTTYGSVKSFTTLMSEPAAMTPPGNALDFDGTDDYVLLPNESDFDFTNAMTVAAWIKVDAFTTDWQAIVTKGNGSWRLQRFGNSNHIDFGTSGLSNGDLEGTTNVADGNWHYIAAVFDGSTKYLYVDGNLDASTSVTGTIATTNDSVEIAANSDGNSRNFDGLIDEVRIWNVARTQTELNDKMNIVLSGNETGLVAYYKFDVSSGTYLYDHSGNNNLGKLHNMNNSDWVSSGWPYHPEPRLNTKDAFNIGRDTAQSGGIIVSRGNSPITAKGIVWNKTGNPDITNYLGKTNDGDSTEPFTSTLTGLSDTTVYYVRAYATNNNGTGYGDADTFYTQMAQPPAMTPPGNALDFDGTDDYVSIPNESDFDFTNRMTVAAWIKVDAFTTDWQAIVTKGNDSWRLQRYGNTNHIDFGTSVNSSNIDLEGTTDVADGNWHYVVGVLDDTIKYLYVDGNLDTSVNVTSAIATTDDPVQIGANSGAANKNFDGKIDEVRIWNVARTQTEINNSMHYELDGTENGLVAYYKFDMSSGNYLYDHAGNGNLGKLHNMDNNDWVTSGWPVHPEPLINTTDVINIGRDTAQCGGRIIKQGNSPVTAKGIVWNTTGNPDITNYLGKTNDGDSTGPFTGTLTGLSDSTVYYVRAYATNSDDTGYGDVKTFYTLMAAPPDMTPPGNALDFDGTDDYVSIQNISDFDFTTAVTIAAWIKVNSFTSEWQAIVTKGDGSWRLQRYGNTNHIDFGTTGLSNQDLEGTTDVNDGNWHYIAGVFNGSAKYLYVDGNLDTWVNVTGTIDTTDDPVEIGANSAGASKNFDGLIDEVRIWNVARTQTEIQDNMNITLTGNENGLVAYYKFDMSSGNYLYDHTGNDNLGKLHNMAGNDWTASGWPAQGEPKVTTKETFNIGRDTAQSGGNITYGGVSSITAKGVVWNTTNNPDLTNYLGKTNDGDSTEPFTSTLTGLSDTTVYYVRAYATNGNGTGYGDVEAFYTQMAEPAAMTPPGNALNFDGNDDFVNIQNNSDFNFTNAMTVAAWIRAANFTKDWQTIISKGNGSWRLQRYGSTNHIDFATNGLSNTDLEGTTNVNDGNWHYIAGVFDGSTKYLYVDGNLDASVTVTGTIDTTDDPVEIAANSSGGDRNWYGQIDEVRIWNVARTQTEINNNMNIILAGNENGLVAYYKFDVSSGNYLYDHTGNGNLGKLHNMDNNDWVVSNWPAQLEPLVNTKDASNIGADTAQSGGNITSKGCSAITDKGVVWNTTGNPTLSDNLGSTNDGGGSDSFTSTLTNLSDTTLYYVRAYAVNSYGTTYGNDKSFTTQMSPPPAMTPPGNALDFDGSDDYVSIPNESDFDFTDSMTVAVWIKVDDFTADWQAIVTKGDGTWRLQRYGNTNHIDFGTSGLSNGDLEGTTNVNDGNWHYIAGVFDGSTKYLYVDGNLDASASVTGTISTSDRQVEIAANSDHTGRNFDGLIDELRIWNTPRTQTEIQNHMNNVLTGKENGLVAYYKFDVSSGTYLYDHTGNNNTGRLQNMTNSDWVSSGWTVRYNVTWTGSEDNDWSNANNWSGSGEVPTENDNVDIPNVANAPVIQPGDTARCYKLTIENGATLTVASDATGHGTLIVTGK